jgi:60 kDa SS-A/Ro ribonucleoprotein
MVNTQLFQTVKGTLLPAADAQDEANAPAYAYAPRHRLAQLAATGCLGHTFHADAQTQLEAVLSR